MTTLDYARHAAALARAVDLLRRSPEPGDPQKSALRALVALAAERSCALRFYGGVLTVDGAVVPVSDPRLAAFAERLGAQHVAEIIIALGAGPDELLALALGLAADAGQGRIKEKLRDAGSMRVMVILHQSVDGTAGSRTVSGAFEKVMRDQEVMSEWNKFLDHGAKGESERHVHAGPAEVDQRDAAGASGAGSDAAAPARPPAAVPLPSRAPAAPIGAAAAPPLAQPPTLKGASPLGTSLLRLVSEPYGPDTLARLTQIARFVQDSFSQDRVAEAIDAVNALVDLEAKAPDTAARGTYRVIIGRILTHTALEKTAPYLLEPRRRDRAGAVLRRGGEPATDLLVSLISGAHTLGERIQYVAVLRDIPQGTDRLVALLSSRTEWQVARNVAEVVGEARIEAAVPYLARLLDADDERLRRAALVAMARIGSAATAEPLRNVLKSGTPELRSLVASSIGGPHARALTGPLASLADEEENPDILAECFRALGRIGTPEAIQSLERAVGRSALFSRRHKAARAAAVEVLRSLGRG